VDKNDNSHSPTLSVMLMIHEMQFCELFLNHKRK
jgi:hypothetical protein